MSDTLSQGEDRRPRRWPRVAVALVATLGAGLLVLDDHRRGTEMARLLDAVESSQATVAFADRRVSAMRQYLGPVFTSGDEDLYESLNELLAGAGRTAAVEVDRRRGAVAAVDVLPWHDDQEEAQQSYLAYLDARVTWLESVGRRDGRAGERRDAVARTWSDAAAALVRAVPPDARERLDALPGDPLS